MNKTLKNMKMAHGKIEPKYDSKYVPSTLDQLWGDTGLAGNYDTLEESEYKTKLDEMNKSDLQAHAVRIGLIPVDNRETLVNRLMREFRVHVASYKVPKQMVNAVKNKKTVDTIMSEGR